MSRSMRRVMVLLFVPLFFVGLVGARCEKVIEPHDGPGLLAGACSVDITPIVGVNHSDPIYMAGFGQDRQAQGVRDPIWARGVVLENGDTKIALVTLDLVGYFNNEVQTIRSLVDPARGFDSITVTSTHNHEGPDTMGLWGPADPVSGVDLGYLDFVNDSVAACIAAADDARVPAAIKFATGSTEGLSVAPWPDLVADGRVLEELEIDLSLVGGQGILFVQGDDGPILNASVPTFQLRERVPLRDRFEALVAWLFHGGEKPDMRPLRDVIATLVNYASHPEALGSGNDLLTSDFPHGMRTHLEAAYGGVAIYMSADLGVLQGPLDVDMDDLETGEPVPRRTFEFADEMGRRLGVAAEAALEAEHVWDGAAEIEVTGTGGFLVEVENPFFQVLGSLGVFGRRELLQDQGAVVLETEVQALRIGAGQIVVTPNELDPQIGDLYRNQMTHADHRFVAGLGNDEIGYQMPAEKFNPSCFLCAGEILSGQPQNCPLLSTLDCDTVFQNNVGPSADPQLQQIVSEQLGILNP